MADEFSKGNTSGIRTDIRYLVNFIKCLFSKRTVSPDAVRDLSSVGLITSLGLTILSALVGAGGKVLFQNKALSMLFQGQMTFWQVVTKSVLSFAMTFLSMLLLSAAMLGLLFLLFLIRKTDSVLKAHLAVTSVASVIFLLLSALMTFMWKMPWDILGFIFVAFIINRYTRDNTSQESILDTFAVMAVWLTFFTLAVRPLMFLFG